jgi:methylmalonyl-CoA mutase N-terminal domain/subunit
MGGMIPAIEKGYPQAEIARASYDYQRKVEAGEVTVVGVNRFQETETAAPEILRIDLRRSHANRKTPPAARKAQ